MDRCQAKALRVAIRELKDAAAAQAFDANAYYRLGARYPQAVRAAPPRPLPAARPQIPSRPVAAAGAPRVATPTRPAPAQENAGELPKGERAVLAALIQYPEGLRREQLTVLTGYKRSSRDTYIQRLIGRGFAAVAGDRITATPDGAAALPDAQPLPTGQALQAFWLARLPLGERKLLEVLLGAYPQAVERSVLSELTAYQRSSRDTYLQRLAAKELVASIGGGVRASDTLFEG